MRARALIVAAEASATLLLAAPPVQATSPDCFYDTNTNKATVNLNEDVFARLFVASGGEIKVQLRPELVDCDDATTANTETIEVLGGELVGDQVVVIAQNGAGGPFPPNAIAFFVDGGPGEDELRLVGTNGSDSFRFGKSEGIGNPLADLNGNDPWGIDTFDVESASVRMLGGGDRVTGDPAGSLNSPFTLPLDLKGNRGPDSLVGAVVGDDIAGGAGGDLEKGLAGPDDLLGQAGDDDLSGGPGVDDCSGGPGDDRLRGCES